MDSYALLVPMREDAEEGQHMYSDPIDDPEAWDMANGETNIKFYVSYVLRKTFWRFVTSRWVKPCAPIRYPSCS